MTEPPMTKDISQAQELLPCPFCGDAMFSDGETFGHTDSDLPCIIAKQAWAATDRAIAAWNTRVPVTGSAQELVEMVDTLEMQLLTAQQFGEAATTRIAELEAQVAALQALPERGWQPIETAPKDGRSIIAARFKHQDFCWVSHTRWITALEIADLEGGEPDYYEAGWVDGNRDDEPIYPTHWMPLPPPPVTPKGGEE